ncbi:MAG: hypothetical protein AAB581_00365 [Patescibacteria group bacterium]
MPKKAIKKLKIGIFDFTDCEGCEVVLVSLGQKIVDFLKDVDIVDWRLGQKMARYENLDAAFIEGSPITQDEIDQLKDLRSRSKLIVAVGACAALGGIPAIVTKAERQKMYDAIYGTGYKPRGIDSLPLTAYVKVDFFIHGCPVDADELSRILHEIKGGKTPQYRGYSVCYDCKEQGNPCRLIEGKTCLGPITQGGCKAVCVSGGLPCFGCFGLREGANIPALMKVLETRMTKKEMANLFSTFLKATPEYKKYFENV